MTNPQLKYALIGNPNSGKTTLFNALTGARQRVGNWPGVTVERKIGHFRHGNAEIELIDLPGIYNLASGSSEASESSEQAGITAANAEPRPIQDDQALDERIAREFLEQHHYDAIINVVDASSLSRGLFLTTQLQELGVPMVVVLNMVDVADKEGVHIDTWRLSEALGCPVVPMVASRREGLGVLKDTLDSLDRHPLTQRPKLQSGDFAARYQQVDQLVNGVIHTTPIRQSITERIDRIVLHPVLAFPVFLLVMYLMFMFTINVGNAFLDFFDLAGTALFVEGPKLILQQLGTADWLVFLLADSIGGGIQLVATFIPIIGCLFLFLSFLEDSGYIGRAAFIIDRLMKRIGLPGKAFVPLIVGFGCNVPAIMATRTLDNQQDRILTTIMAPYMSCGARLTVYALFVTAFFENNGTDIIFALYLIGILVAVISALIVRRFLLSRDTTRFVMELPAYHLPTLRGVLLQTWQRLKGFVFRAGKAIVTVFIVLNIVSSVGTDGSFDSENTDRSLIAALGKTLTPAFHPMGLNDDNWPATVGIFTGVFAKEVVVGTLDALYTGIANGEQQTQPEAFDFAATLGAAVRSIPENLKALSSQITNPLGLNLSDSSDLAQAAESQSVSVGTLSLLRGLFEGDIGAFSYLLFILLYVPCAATVGTIYKEISPFWAIFGASWSIVMAYTLAVLFYQGAHLTQQPITASLWCLAMLGTQAAGFGALIHWGRSRLRENLIPLTHLD